jgi:hypothetical protein
MRFDLIEIGVEGSEGEDGRKGHDVGPGVGAGGRRVLTADDRRTWTSQPRRAVGQ